MAGQISPLASSTSGLEFARMPAKEIRKISVKRIHSTPALDTMLGPVPGGLYDPAMGAIQALDKNCTTCCLNWWHCAGHCGHIELPVPCYHPLFVDTTLRLLRAACVYCHRFRLSLQEINRVTCELQLLQHGLLDDYRQLRAVTRRKTKAAKDGEFEDDDNDDDESMVMRQRFVRLALRKVRKQDQASRLADIQNPTAVETRRQIIAEFIQRASNNKTCSRCQGVTPSYRKDNAVKFFRKPLSATAKEKMRVAEKKAVNPLIFLQSQQKQRAEKTKPLANGVNHDGEEEAEEESEHGAEDEIALQNAVETTAQAKNADLEDEEEAQAYMTTTEVHAALTLLFEREQEIVNLLFSSGRDRASITPDMLFIRAILVPPNKYRPLARQGPGQMLEAQQNSILNRIIKASNDLQQIQRIMRLPRPESGAPRRSLGEQIQAAVTLQEQVNLLIDQPPNPAGRVSESGIKQTLEKKGGLFRMNMMGKRVNFAARSVISPDPNIETNEIGVPLVFAKKLTYPEPVTSQNFEVLQQAVINGCHKWPGASAIENENGMVMSLKKKTPEQRKALAKQLRTTIAPGARGDQVKKVYRHLQTGDVVIMNRQPTLHKPSMMCHKAKVLTNQKTIRMHYANCNTYNADFDGDEMNMHFPQNELARAEATQIADTDHQYLSATSGKPLRGLIQDHISMGVQFTGRDTFFEREQYQELLYNCLRPEDSHTIFERIEIVPPAILKPKMLWTGKQVISAILQNITPDKFKGVNLTSKSSTPSKSWGETTVMDSSNFEVSKNKIAFCDTEQVVIFKDGQHLCGILDKSQMGPSAGGLVHSVHELYGHVIAGKLLSVLGRLLTRFLNERAWTCGMDDLYLTDEGDEKRRQELKKAKRLGFEVASEYVTLKPDQVTQQSPVLLNRLENVLRNDNQLNGLDQLYKSKVKSVTDNVSDYCLPAGLRKPFPRNQMQAMTISGAKGSSVNANLISCNLGQQVLEGRRVPVMVSGKSLPSFQAFETDPVAGGYVSGRFLTGIKPQEYFFHAMSGREGLIDTAVKTSKSGYLQRCVVKGLEGVKVEYDTSVREASNGSIVQFLYGEDGLEVTKQKHLKEFSFLAQNNHTVATMMHAEEMVEKLQHSNLGDEQKAILKAVRKGLPLNGFGRNDDSTLQMIDPILSVHTPSNNFGSTSEAFAAALANYLKDNPDRVLKDKKTNPNGIISRKTFQKIMELKYMRSLVDPGEAVGVVAAQSIGEPSTQMTLNTFHLAGHSAKNVTLGIPRLREIIMTATPKIMTPTMTVKPIEEASMEEAVQFAKGVSRLTLADVMKELHVTERAGGGEGYENDRIYDIVMQFYDPEDYQEEYNIKSRDVLKSLQDKFMPRLMELMKIEQKKKGDEELMKESLGTTSKVGASVGRSEEARAPRQNNGEREAGEEGGDDDIDGDDAKDAAQRGRREDTFDEPDDDERQIEKAMEADPDVDDEKIQQVNEAEEEESNEQKQAKTDGKNNEDESEDEDEEEDAELAAEKVKGQHPAVKKFIFTRKPGKPCRIILSYDPNMAKLLLLPIVEKAVHASTIQVIPGVGMCSLFMEEVKGSDGKIIKVINEETGKEEDLKEPVITTEGVNLQAMQTYQDIISPHTIYTNSVHDMLRHYGVEAARMTIIKEIDTVFKGHGISVDNRHINLIADAMTQSGGYKPFSRHGVVKESGSALAKMSFETVMGFLREAVLHGENDPLLGPSARIVAGRRSNVGTGSFDVVMSV